VDERYGQIRVRTPGGTLITVFGTSNAPDPIRRGEDVILTGYNITQRMYTVTRA